MYNFNVSYIPILDIVVRTLMSLCLSSFVSETPWGWHLGVETYGVFWGMCFYHIGEYNRL